MILSSLLPIVLGASGITPQDSAPASAPTGEGWERVDGVAAIAGDAAVTLGQLRAFIDRRGRQFNIELTTQAEYDDAIAKGLQPSITLQLEAQAGRDLGLDAARIRGVIEAQLNEQRKDLGPTEFRQLLDDQGLDALTAGSTQSDDLYTSAYRAHVVGRRGGISERPVKDRFVRPGELKAIYAANRDDLGQPAQVQFQDLVVSVDEAGGIIEARSLANDLREQALDGEDFDLLVEQFGIASPETLGVTQFFAANQLVNPEVREFAETSEVGDYSDVYPILQNDEVAAFRFLKLYAREEGTPPPRFIEPGVQDFLRNQFLNRRDNALLDQARARLLERAYIWRSPEYPAPDLEDAEIPPLLRRP